MRDDYMVTGSVWEAAGGGPGHLCFECLAQALKRPLALSDFRTDLPINRGILLGASLAPGP